MKKLKNRKLAEIQVVVSSGGVSKVILFTLGG